jgi:hypothetical protein
LVTLDAEHAGEWLEVAVVVQDNRAALGSGRRDQIVGCR